MNRKLLVVVDMQNDFIDGSLGTPEAQLIVPKVIEKIKDNEGGLYMTMDMHLEDYLDTQEGELLPVLHCIEGTHGVSIHKNVSKAAIDKGRHTVQHKDTFGSIELGKLVQDGFADGSISEVELVGLCTDICVISNALLIKAFCPEIKITVDASCCAGVTPESHKNALEAMKMCQINVIGEE